MTDFSGLEVAVRTKSDRYEIRGEINDAKALDLIRITEALKIVAKPGLVKWQVAQPFEWFFKHIDEVIHELKTPDDPKRLMPQRREIIENKFKTDSAFAAFRGTNVHHMAEQKMAGTELPWYVAKDIEEYPEDFALYDASLDQAIDELGLELISAELKLVNLTHRYAGTADLICNTKNYGRCILDWKTSKRSQYSPYGVYLEYMLQQIAYAHAEYEVSTEDFTDEGDVTRGKLVPFTPPDNILLVNVTNTKTREGAAKPYAVVPVPKTAVHPRTGDTIQVWGCLFEAYKAVLSLNELENIGSSFFKEAFFATDGKQSERVG